MVQMSDYYKILQVHYQAEPEIIESAYKRLARKYHPDVNPSFASGDMMQLINEAYSILSDPHKRREYNRCWEERMIRQPDREQNASADSRSENTAAKQKNDMLFLSAKAMLEEYFHGIKKNDYGRCYELISAMDKQNISKEDFIKWQEAVSRVYTIKEYRCDIYGVYRDKLINGRMYSNALEFTVSTVEYNIVMDMLQKDIFNKTLLLEEGKWKVFIGYEKLEPLINKFNDLKGLLNAKSILNELSENQSKLDNDTGLMNQRGLLEMIEREIIRYERYSNAFSMILCEIDIVKLMNAKEEREVTNAAVKHLGEMLKSNLRKLDLVGRWNNNSILILLPETGLMPAIKVNHKVQKLLKEYPFCLTGKTYRMVAKLGITEYYSSLEETLDRIYNQLM